MLIGKGGQVMLDGFYFTFVSPSHFRSSLAGFMILVWLHIQSFSFIDLCMQIVVWFVLCVARPLIPVLSVIRVLQGQGSGSHQSTGN